MGLYDQCVTVRLADGRIIEQNIYPGETHCKYDIDNKYIESVQKKHFQTFHSTWKFGAGSASAFPLSIKHSSSCSKLPRAAESRASCVFGIPRLYYSDDGWGGGADINNLLILISD